MRLSDRTGSCSDEHARTLVVLQQVRQLTQRKLRNHVPTDVQLTAAGDYEASIHELRNERHALLQDHLDRCKGMDGYDDEFL